MTIIERYGTVLRCYDNGGRSMGPQCIPLLIRSSRSLGGPGILDHCIIRIDEIDTHRTLYRHPTFSDGTEGMSVFPSGGEGTEYAWSVGVAVNEPHASFKTEKQAKNWLAFMRGERYSK